MCNKFYRILIAILFVLSSSYFATSTPLDSADNSLHQLQREIELVLKDYKGLCSGIALIRQDQPDWIVGIGNSGVSENKHTPENTMFRVASISKMFVAFAILQLQEKGRLTLEDKVKDIVPEVEFENPWEETNPVRIVHLLEHTTGWDEIHLVEMIHNQSPSIALKNALGFHPYSRKSRWTPGARMSYCNSGYAVAAYIVEKVSGLSFEEYVDSFILEPLKMNHTTFFNDSIYQQYGANILMNCYPDLRSAVLQSLEKLLITRTFIGFATFVGRKDFLSD